MDAKETKCYITRRISSDGKVVYAVIYKGNPVCRDMDSVDKAISAAAAMNVTPHGMWDGDKGEFVA